MSEEYKEFIFEFEHMPTELHTPTTPKKLKEKFPYSISFYGDQHIGKPTLWKRFKMWLRYQRLKRM